MQRESLRLLVITDNLRDGIDGLTQRARAARRGGATMIQLRLPDEGARVLSAVARALVAALDAPVVVHGRADVALAAGAAGVHLDLDDISISDARKLCGRDFVVGRSAATAEDLLRAEGADYIAVGPTFPTKHRHPATALGISEFEKIARSAGVPVIAVGGITAATAGDAMRAGASGVALISGVFGSRDPERAAREVLAAIGK